MQVEERYARVHLTEGGEGEANLFAAREKDKRFGLEVRFDKGEEEGELLVERAD